jgi:tripartite-type tricarboxylate transporter receptor subunit TctC
MASSARHEDMARDFGLCSEAVSGEIKMKATKRRAILASILATPVLAAGAQTARPVRFIVPFPPGGTADLLARLVAREMEARLGAPVVVENRAGAGGVVGSDSVAKSPADGTTILLSNIASQGIAPAILPTMPYDVMRDFTHIGLLAAVPSAIAVSATRPWQSLPALIAAAREKPGTIRFGSNGNGTSSHAKLEILKRLAGVDITHVPYRGAAPAATDVIAGNIDGLIAAIPDVGRNERLRLLAMTTEQRLPRWPDVPSVAELGLAPLVAANWFGISGPAGIPAPVADRLNAALVESLATPALTERLSELGAAPNRLDRPAFTALVATDMARWAQIVREAGIKAD